MPEIMRVLEAARIYPQQNVHDSVPNSFASTDGIWAVGERNQIRLSVGMKVQIHP